MPVPAQRHCQHTTFWLYQQCWTGKYYNCAGQLYLGPHINPSVAGTYPTQNFNNTREQPVYERTQLDPPVMARVQGNCYWCWKTYDEVALDALAANTVATEYPGETVRDRNNR